MNDELVGICSEMTVSNFKAFSPHSESKKGPQLRQSVAPLRFESITSSISFYINLIGKCYTENEDKKRVPSQ
jgi:hypothetical protein